MYAIPMDMQALFNLLMFAAGTVSAWAAIKGLGDD
jgi:ABC-type microcin C transport system permease subunit YejB